MKNSNVKKMLLSMGQGQAKPRPEKAQQAVIQKKKAEPKEEEQKKEKKKLLSFG